jgi:iron(III) transport system ATP-binding protein
MMSTLRLNQISLQYSGVKAIDDISLILPSGKIGCLLGPSGCGKTSLLRVIAGFEKQAMGTITLDDQILSNEQYSLAPEKRKIGMVSQEIALFPHLNVSQNIAFGLRHLAPHEKKQRVDRLLEMTALEKQALRHPHQLSGGQQQRVALARALAPQPSMILFDEPFSNLDVELRMQLAKDVQTLLKAESVTALWVTHDPLEAFAISDFMGVLQDGKLRQWDTPENLYSTPQHVFVAEFLGLGSVISAEIIDAHTVMTSIGILKTTHPMAQGPASTVQCLIRPEQIIFDAKSPLSLPIIERSYRGHDYNYTLKTPNQETIACTLNTLNHYEQSMAIFHPRFEIGDQLPIRLSHTPVVIF